MVVTGRNAERNAELEIVAVRPHGGLEGGRGLYFLAAVLDRKGLALSRHLSGHHFALYFVLHLLDAPIS